jgi:phosphatidylserine decarboxylase
VADPVSFLFWRFYYFFRDPKRVAPPGRVIVSPADGCLLYVKEIKGGVVPSPVKEGVAIPLEEWFGNVPFTGEGTLIGIYMTPISVHYNRAPIAGTIKKVVKRPAIGENFSMARTLIRIVWNMRPFEKDSSYIANNARNTIVIDGELPIVTVQIADRWISEVDCFVREGQEVATGDKIGMIRMGSQCDIFIPKKPNLIVNLTCKPGEMVYAGTSILATYDIK